MKIEKIQTNLNPWWVTGFSDGDSSFSVSITKNSLYKTGYRILPAFTIELKNKDLFLLDKIQKFFGGVGRIHILENKGHVVYTVTKINELEKVIIPHFINYSLLTRKKITFLFFKEIVHLIYTKNHLNLEGLQVIINCRQFINKGITEEDLNNMSLPVILPEVKLLKLEDINSNWFVGFTDAEGCFFLNIRLNKNKTSSWVTPVFSIVQHSKDIPLFYLLKQFLGEGFIIKESNKNVVRYRTENLSFILDRIIPLFNHFSLQSSKLKDYIDFCKACQLMKDKTHLSKEGLLKLKHIKNNMNTKRK